MGLEKFRMAGAGVLKSWFSYTILRYEIIDGFWVSSGEEPERSSTVSTINIKYVLWIYILERLAIVSKYRFPVPIIYVSAALLLPKVINKVKGEKGYTL